MSPDESFPRPRLVATAATVRPGRPLPLRLEVTNPRPTPLEGATAELTLEVERGVLISWQLTLRSVPPEGTVTDAVAESQPAFTLPLNVATGRGELRVVLTAADGAYLNEDRAQIEVLGA